ncbi:hypothetical protein [Larkinella sp.]|uniref:hypothetical protein n=1 Tax=Larkinella sp. TaxID=2034517 RepID=UPI003BA8CFFF
MKKSLTILMILLALGLSVAVRAQTKARVLKTPAAAPARKPAPRTPGTPAADRANSSKLPQKTTPPPPPPPTPPPPPPSTTTQPSPVRGYAWKSSRSPSYGYKKGDNLLNIGVGLSSYYYGNPIGLSYEVGVDKDFSVGAQLDYNSGNYGDYYYNSSRWRYTATYLGLRGSFHANRLLKLNTQKVDLYAGLGLGYRSFRWNDSGYGYGYDSRSGLFLNYFIGGKYYFGAKVGAFLELGYTGLSSSRVGLSVKF